MVPETGLPIHRAFLYLLAVVFVLTTVFLVLVFARRTVRSADKINIKTDYVAEYNRITRPADFDSNENAAPYFEKAFELMPEMPPEIKYLRKLWPGDMNDAELEQLRNWVELSSEAIPYLEQAVRKPYCWVPLQAEDNDLMKIKLSTLSSFRGAAFLLSSHATLLAFDGDVDGAFRQLPYLYRMGSFFAGPKILIDQLVGIAIAAIPARSAFQILDHTTPTADVLKDFQERLYVLSSQESFIIDLTTERLLFYDQVQRLYTDDGKGGGHLYGYRFYENPGKYFVVLISRWTGRGPWAGWGSTDRRRTVQKADKMYDYFNWAAKQTPWYFHSEGIDLEKTTNEMIGHHYLLSVLTPAFTRVSQIAARRRVDTDALVTTLAVLRYKADNGRLPEDLGRLVSTGYLNDLPIDPFSGKPLTYKPTGDDFTIYTYAGDFDDDGGKHDPKWADDTDGDYVFWPVQKDK